MAQAGLTSQTDLAKVLSKPQAELSIMMKYELAVREQNEIVKRIREWSALNTKGE